MIKFIFARKHRNVLVLLFIVFKSFGKIMAEESEEASIQKESVLEQQFCYNIDPSTKEKADALWKKKVSLSKSRTKGILNRSLNSSEMMDQALQETKITNEAARLGNPNALLDLCIASRSKFLSVKSKIKGYAYCLLGREIAFGKHIEPLFNKYILDYEKILSSDNLGKGNALFQQNKKSMVCVNKK